MLKVFLAGKFTFALLTCFCLKMLYFLQLENTQKLNHIFCDHKGYLARSLMLCLHPIPSLFSLIIKRTAVRHGASRSLHQKSVLWCARIGKYPHQTSLKYSPQLSADRSRPSNLPIISYLPSFWINTMRSTRCRNYSSSNNNSSAGATAYDQSKDIEFWADARLLSILDSFSAPVRFAAAYGSGVYKQAGYDEYDFETVDSTVNVAQDQKTPSINSSKSILTTKRPMIDLIFGVTHPEHWHSLNLRQNPHHYSSFSRFGSQAVSVLQERFGAGVYYNTHVTVNGMVRKPLAFHYLSDLYNASNTENKIRSDFNGFVAKRFE